MKIGDESLNVGGPGLNNGRSFFYLTFEKILKKQGTQIWSDNNQPGTKQK